jgi:hypothetical protein
LKSTEFWDVLPCSSEKNPRFRRNLSPPSSGQKINPSKKPAEEDGKLRNSEDGGDNFLQKFGIPPD